MMKMSLATTKPGTDPYFWLRIVLRQNRGKNRSLSPVSGRGALRLRRPARFGQSEILREIVHADHLVAQLSRALEQRLLFASDHVRGERSLRELLGRPAAYRPGFLRCADLGLDCLGLDRRLEGDRKSTRLNSSHDQISYAVFC